MPRPMIVLGAALSVWAATAACTPSPPPTLADLSLAADAVEDSGERLMDAPAGLHRLDAGAKAALPARTIVAVHGFQSRGIEWVAPLHTLAAGGTAVHFYRWDWNQCPDGAAKDLARTLADVAARMPAGGHLTVVAHSYGGVIATLAAAVYDGPVPLEVEVVAAPLAGHPLLRQMCDYNGVGAVHLPATVHLRQWRTKKELDGAFRDLDVDPQVVELPGTPVVTLPERYQGERLGHNRSVSWVAEQLVSASR